MKLTHNVAPRYTPGSPALVDRVTAERVAAQEIESHRYFLKGYHGTEGQERATNLGLAWIVWETSERRGKLIKADMLTGEITSQRIKRDGTLSETMILQPAA